MGTEAATSREAPAPGYSAAATHGSAWTTAQTLLSKLLTVVAGLVLTRLLVPSEYGIAFFAAHLCVFFFPFPTFVMGDVLQAQASRFDRIAGAANRVMWVVAIATFVVVAAAALPIERWSGRDGLALLIVVAATRPLADAMLAIWNARMRIDLEYRRIAVIDAVVIFAATAASVVMAWLGAGPISLTLPPIAALALKGLAYRRSLRERVDLTFDATEVRPIARRFAVAGLGQYVNNILLSLEIVVLGAMSDETELGLYVLAATYAIQANTIIAGQLGAVLQPIFVHVSHDPVRQVAGFMRATRLLSAVAVPLSLIQSAIAVPAFTLLFETEWRGAIAIFAVLSVGQAFVFVSAPAVVLLKAQGRFRAFLKLQVAQLMVSVASFALAVRYGGETAMDLAAAVGLPTDSAGSGALALSIASSIVGAIFCPIAVWIGGRPAGLGVVATARMFLEPWIVALPVATALLLATSALRDAISPFAADLLSVIVLAPVAAIVGVLGCLSMRADTRADFIGILRRFRRVPK